MNNLLRKMKRYGALKHATISVHIYPDGSGHFNYDMDDDWISFYSLEQADEKLSEQLKDAEKELLSYGFRLVSIGEDI